MQSPFYIRWPDKKDIDGLKSRGPPGFVHACGIGDTREIVNRKREGDRGKDYYYGADFGGYARFIFFPPPCWHSTVCLSPFTGARYRRADY